MNLLLASRWLDAVPGFLRTTTATARPRVGFIGTASSLYPDPAWLEVDREALQGFGCELVELDPTSPEFAADLDTLDAVFVSGGNTFHLLHVFRTTGAEQALIEKVRAGLPYIGVSAGAAITGPDIEPVSLMDDATETAPLDSTEAWGLVDVVVIPHADGIVGGTQVVDDTRTRYADRFPLLFITDDQAVLVSDGSRSVISS
ncbi:Type 1 glutamine amidotransferase-like domain-containing protein [Gordonia sp. CPCC 205515]|uniref:Type 1 glutamine amidotransferase-like domain-containing protein n=1 Tax=Gordonia sp. CPCC 205515 TaxID=3140791 RepID=UPI003AF3B7E3